IAALTCFAKFLLEGASFLRCEQPIFETAHRLYFLVTLQNDNDLFAAERAFEHALPFVLESCIPRFLHLLLHRRGFIRGEETILVARADGSRLGHYDD